MVLGKHNKGIWRTCFFLSVIFLMLPGSMVHADGFSFEIPYKIYKMPPYINGAKIDCIVFDRKRKRELARESTDIIRIGDTKNTMETGNVSMIFNVPPSRRKYMKKPMIYECRLSLCRGRLCMSPRPNSWASVSKKSYWKETGTLEPLKKK